VTDVPTILHFQDLEPEDGLVHGFSTTAIGSVGLTHAPDPKTVHESRRRFAANLGLDPSSITVIGAVHGAEVARVEAPQERIEGVDAVVTNRPGIALFATYADCYPIVLWDQSHHAAALVHSGWRGTEAGVATAAVRALANEFGSKPAEIRAGIGPGICGRCYEVGGEVADRFDKRFIQQSAGGRFLRDLRAANRAQLEREGVREIFSLDLCTKETAFLPSHRRDPDGTRFGALVAIR